MKDAGIIVKLIPGSLTPVAQQLDLWINRLMKDHQRMCYENWALRQTMDASGKMPYPNRALVAKWVLDASDSITPHHIIHPFVKSGITKPTEYTIEQRREYELDNLYLKYLTDPITQV